MDQSEPIKNRTIILQDIKLSNGGFGKNKNIIDMFFNGRQSLFFRDLPESDYFTAQYALILGNIISYIQNSWLQSYHGVLEKVYSAGMLGKICFGDYFFENIF